MNYFTSLLLLLSCFAAQAATITITNDDLQGGNEYNWTSDNTYLLDGLVVLENGGVLNIEAGTVIKGMAVPTDPTIGTSALVIARGAIINATGTADAPVIFTAEVDDIEDGTDISYFDRGLWGGLVVLGNAPIAADSTSVPLLQFDAVMEGALWYGGENETDNSGVLSHVSIRHSGAEIADGEALDGLYLGAVGSTTIVDHIEVYAGADDAISMAGGTVNLKYLSVSFNSDESIDWDLGWRGKGQFWLALQDAAGDRCGEHDGGIPDEADPFSRPIIANVTYIGPGIDAQSDAPEALVFRDRSGGIYTNSIFTNFPQYALNVEDRSDRPDSYDHLQTGNLLFNCNYWWDFGAGNSWSEMVHIEATYEDQGAAVLISSLESTQNSIADPMLSNLSSEPEVFDPRLSPGSPALNAGCALDDPFFDPVPYVGAFDAETIWLQSWTGMDANAFFAFVTSTDVIAPGPDFKVYPNPTHDLMAVEGLENNTTLRVFTMNGQLLFEQLAVGETATIQLASLPAGMYMLQVQTSEGTYTEKIIKAE